MIIYAVEQADLDRSASCGNAGSIEYGLPGDLAPQRDAWAAAGATHWQSVRRGGGGVITRPVRVAEVV